MTNEQKAVELVKEYARAWDAWQAAVSRKRWTPKHSRELKSAKKAVLELGRKLLEQSNETR